MRRHKTAPFGRRGSEGGRRVESVETVHPGYDILADFPDARRRGAITRRRGVSTRRSWRRGAEAGGRGGGPNEVKKARKQGGGAGQHQTERTRRRRTSLRLKNRSLKARSRPELKQHELKQHELKQQSGVKTPGKGNRPYRRTGPHQTVTERNRAAVRWPLASRRVRHENGTPLACAGRRAVKGRRGAARERRERTEVRDGVGLGGRESSQARPVCLGQQGTEQSYSCGGHDGA